jgi:hypothetical protein
MPAISFEGQQAWVVARWAFCAYLDHVREEVRDSPDLVQTVERAMALDGLHLSLLDADVTDRLMPILLRVADEVVAGLSPARVEGKVLDSRSQAQFQEAVRELRQFLRQHLGST